MTHATPRHENGLSIPIDETPNPSPLDAATDINSDDGVVTVVLGRPDIGAIFRTILPPPSGAVEADGEQAMPINDGIVVFACGPAKMIQKVQVSNPSR